MMMHPCRFWRDRRGSVLIAAYAVLALLLVFCSIFFMRSLSDRKLFDISRERTEALYLADAGVDRGIRQLFTSNNTYSGILGPFALGRGEYELNVTSLAPATYHKILATGYVPSKAQVRAERRIEAVTKRKITPNFYDYALYSSDTLDLSGAQLAYDVNGKAIYASTVAGNLKDICYTDPVTLITTCSSPAGSEPVVTRDPNISPLARFDFSILRAIAESQTNPNTTTGNNIYTAADLTNPIFPSTFYYQDNPANGPNVVYVEGAMNLTGNETVGGFFVVVGNILTDPAVTIDTTLGGNITVNGSIYTTGDFTLNGGGAALNVNGGVWAGTGIEIDGGGTVTYNLEYMMAIKALIEGTGAGDAIQLVSWREIE